MAAYDVGAVYHNYQQTEDVHDEESITMTKKQAQSKFYELITNFRPSRTNYQDQDRCIYRDQLLEDKTRITVDLWHIKAMCAELGELVEKHPAEYLPLLEAAAKQVLQAHASRTTDGELETFDDVQAMLTSSEQFGVPSLRELTSDQVQRLVRIPGIVTAASKPKHKATHIIVQCKTCGNTLGIACSAGMGVANVPSSCRAPQLAPPGTGVKNCGASPYLVLPDRSTYVDQQTLKLQERPEDIPTGELPRTLMMVADRALVNLVTPGTRVVVTGIYSTFRASSMETKGSAVHLQQPYIRVVGIEQEAGDAHKTIHVSPEQQAEFKSFAAQPNVHEELFRMMAPKIFTPAGSRIKEAVACLLFGGSRKALPDGTARRGDINVLLLGDPSTAKSQFLKFVSKVAPIAVYTSGKGSSAAGLTASVIQDANTREFYLEGGAMVLADGGVCCIDEFDKMRDEDRVAIHEAMEQQTISIAKAGITTMLRSRTSVLAAANPPSGRYDDLKSAQDNIDLQSTVLSRFDLIFIVKDNLGREQDKTIAEHVLKVHRDGTMPGRAADDENEDEVWLKQYIHYCRDHCHPRIGEEAAQQLGNIYVQLRETARRTAAEEKSDQPAVPITVRQLEALVRISESLARMALQEEVTPAHVARAQQLFEASTMDALTAGLVEVGQQQIQQYSAVMERIKQRIQIHGTISLQRLLEDMAAMGERESHVQRVLLALAARKDVELIRERRFVRRLR